MKVTFTPTFIRIYKNLPKQLQQETKEKITLFETDQNHPFLKTHKLKGKLKGRYSFSVNYRYRVVFMYSSTSQVTLLTVGDHDVYK